MIRWHKYRGQTTWPKFCNSGIGLRAGSLPPPKKPNETKKKNPRPLDLGALTLAWCSEDEPRLLAHFS